MAQPDAIPLHQRLTQDASLLAGVYDQTAQELIEAVRPEGYFDGLDPEDLAWPPTVGPDGPIRPDGLRRRARIVDAIYHGVPGLRDDRLSESFEQFEQLYDAYHVGNRIYLRVRAQFVENGAGTAQDFLELYQTLYVQALAKGDDFTPDVGEAALARAGISRTPLSHAQAVAGALSDVVLDDDPRWEQPFSTDLDGEQIQGSLRELLRDVAQRTLDCIAAGELLATRYNTYTNLGWFGSSVWHVVAHADAHIAALQEQNALPGKDLEEIQSAVALGKAMLIEFFQAHRENPSKLRPENYWYGQDYSYLTRDMIDRSTELVHAVNAALDRAGSPEDGRMSLPALLAGTSKGRFLEYPHVGRSATRSGRQRAGRLARWIPISWRAGRKRLKLLKEDLDPPVRVEKAWHAWQTWAKDTIDNFGIQVKVTVDPRFHAATRELGLGSGKQRVLFLPTHQSIIDHTVFFNATRSPEMLEAMGWDVPKSCIILARTGLAKAGLKIGPLDITMFGVSSATFDRMFVDLDGYITIDHSERAGPTAQRVVKALDERPGLIYPMATTGAFPEQSFPLQHGLFAQLPQDVVIIPMAYRGAHGIWPKCPRGNLNINPGLVEVVVAPPMLGETTLLPRRRSLRIQLEAANLFQAVHITTLLNPDHREPPSDVGQT